MFKTSTITAVCKSIRECGFPKAEEHQVEDIVRRQLESSGPEYVLSRLSELREWRKKHMLGETSYKPEWFKFRVKDGATRPTDKLGAILWKHGDKAFFALVGAISKAVELSIPTEKQLSKWLGGVRCANESEKTRTLHQSCPASILRELEYNLEVSWNQRKFFGFEDLTATVIPGSGKTVSIRYDERLRPTAKSLVNAYAFTLDTTPLVTWEFTADMLHATSFGEVYDNPVQFRKELELEIQMRKSNGRLIDEAENGHDWDPTAFTRGTRIYTPVMGMCHSVGVLLFMQQEAGKLRVAADPGRMTQWASVPLGIALQGVLYPKLHDCYTLDQESGLLWAQRKLRDGVELSSFDMSSATDRLDYKKFLYEYFSRAYNTEDYPLLKRNLEFFEDISSCPWSIPGYVADLLGACTTQMSWTVGQPLGLRPSFPLLSIMNCALAAEAVWRTDGVFTTGHFACVGDDMIIESKYQDAYVAAVQAFNGEINLTKTMRSSRCAEFCSQLITPNSWWPLKPRYDLEPDGVLNNIEKFTVEGLKPKSARWQRDLHDRLAAWKLDRFGSSYRSSPKSEKLMKRVLANAILDLVHQKGLPDPDSVSIETLLTRTLKEKGRLEYVVTDLASSWADSAYALFGGFDESHRRITVKGSKVKFTCDICDFYQRFSSLGSTSVDLSVKKEWDWRSGSYALCTPSSQITIAKKALKALDRISVEDAGDILSAALRLDFLSGRARDKIDCELITEFNGLIVHGELFFRYNGHEASIDVSDELESVLGERLYEETRARVATITSPAPEWDSSDSPQQLLDEGDLEL